MWDLAELAIYIESKYEVIYQALQSYYSLFDGGGVPQYYIMVDRPDMISIGKWLVYGKIDGWRPTARTYRFCKDYNIKSVWVHQ